MLDSVAVEQVRVALEERLVALGPPTLPVDRDEVKPGSRDRLVVLVWGPVASSDMSDRCRRDIDGLVDGIQPQVAPRELKVLTMAEASARADDRVEDLKVTCPHYVDRTRSPPTAQPRASSSPKAGRLEGHAEPGEYLIWHAPPLDVDLSGSELVEGKQLVRQR
jgi:hypothetical protein